ncbi:MAG TPA: respiratory nitrate reductase subunit gamma [Dehalococcoidia bacterium]|nr:respiratory nitrate reductase subunit gamma [Dehalococcoidia bacterium]
MSEEPKAPKKDKVKGAGGLFIPAGLFIGMGIGWALDYLVQGMFIGLGAGFLLFGIVMLTVRD